MTSYCTEVVKILVNDAFKDDSDVLRPVFDILSSVNGMQRGYHGLVSEDKQSLYFIQEWETIQHHHNFMEDAEQYGKLLEAFKTFLASYTLIHVNFVDDPRKAFVAPVTEISTWNLKEDVPKEKAEMLLMHLVNVLSRRVPTESDPRGRGSWGSVVEDVRKLVFVHGWDSLEAMTNTVKASEEAAAIIRQLHELADLHSRHVELRVFK